jgi:nucleoside-diphosphate-sugar epimerase
MKALLVGGAGATGILIAEGLERRGYELTILHRGVHEPQEIARFRHLHADPHFDEPVREALGSESFDVVVLTYGRVKTLAPLFAGRCARLIAVGGIPIYAGYLDPASRSPRGMITPSDENAPLAGTAGSSKAAKFGEKMVEAERAVLEQHARGSYSATLFRYPVIYGPHGISLIGNGWSFIRRVRDKRGFILLPNDGLGLISRCAAPNAAHCMLLALDTPAAGGEVFNCADDEQFTLGQWAQIALELLGAKPVLVGLPQPLNWAAAHLLPLGGTVADHAIVDAGKAKRVLGYRDAVAPRDAFAKTLEWQARNPPAETGAAWEDPFDYALEDQVMGLLERLYRDAAPLTREVAAVHPYPHPTAPATGRDHRGR